MRKDLPQIYSLRRDQTGKSGQRRLKFIGWEGEDAIDFCATILEADAVVEYSESYMDRPVTRHELYAAFIRILRAKRVENPQYAVEVLGAPHDGVRLFAVILFESAKAALTDHLARITGRFHPTVADMWLLDEMESLALIQTADTVEALRIG